MKFNVKITIVALLLLLISGLIVACGSSSDEAATEAEPEATEVMEEEATEEEEAEAETVPETEGMTESEAMTETESMTETEAASEESTSESTSGAVTLAMVSEQSEARFYIDEVLLGNDFTVVGTTSDVTGEITVDPSDPASATVGTITIDPSTLETDDNRRTNTLGERILNVADYPTITFEPTSISGLPDSITVGESFEFQVTGNLTILETTLEETFDMSVTPVSETEISGTGTTTILYDDYGITIPSVPMVASVEDEVILEIEFVAAQ